MQLGLMHSDKHHVQIMPYLHDHLTDFEMLTCSIAHRPTHLTEVVPNYPCVIGAMDAAQTEWVGSSLPMENI